MFRSGAGTQGRRITGLDARWQVHGQSRRNFWNRLIRELSELRIGELLAGLGGTVLSGNEDSRGLDVELLRVVVPEAGEDMGPGDLVVLPPGPGRRRGGRKPSPMDPDGCAARGSSRGSQMRADR